MGNYLSRDEIVGFQTADVDTPAGTILVRELPADVMFSLAQSGAVEAYQDDEGKARNRVHMDKVDLIEVALRCVVDPETRAPMFGPGDRAAVNNAGFGIVSAVATKALELTGWAAKKDAEKDAEGAGDDPN